MAAASIWYWSCPLLDSTLRTERSKIALFLGPLWAWIHSGPVWWEDEPSAGQASGRIPTLLLRSLQSLDWLSDVNRHRTLAHCQLNLGHKREEPSALLWPTGEVCSIELWTYFFIKTHFHYFEFLTASVGVYSLLRYICLQFNFLDSTKPYVKIYWKAHPMCCDSMQDHAMHM